MKKKLKNLPSGGTNDATLSASYRPKFTHWWKVTSSTASFKPNFTSGMPERKAFIVTTPLTCGSFFFFFSELVFLVRRRKESASLPPPSIPKLLTSALSTVPPTPTSADTFSVTSKNTSFLLYLSPSRRHPTAPVTCSVAAAAAASRLTRAAEVMKPFWKTRALRALASVTCLSEEEEREEKGRRIRRRGEKE